MSGGLLLSAFLLGLIGIPHCATMCAAPCHGVARRCGGSRAGTDRAVLALHGGRLLGYTGAGAFLAASVSAASSWSTHVAALRPLWLMLQLATVVLGAWLLGTGRLPHGLAWNAEPDPSIAAPSAGVQSPKGLLSAFLAGLGWVFLPCTQLYAGLMVAALASGPVEGGFVAMVFALPGTFAFLAGPRVLRKALVALFTLWAPRGGQPRVVPIASSDGGQNSPGSGAAGLSAWQLSRLDALTVRLAGLALMTSSSWMLAHSAQASWAYLCGV